MNKDVYLKWLDHFKRNVPRGMSPDNKHLLVVDGHTTHVNQEVVLKCVSMDLDILTIPSHSTHFMQPLDVCCFRPFKVHFAKEKSLMINKNPNWSNGKAFKPTLAHMVCVALKKALRISNVISNFQTTGIYPINENAMDKHFGSLWL